jgi:hypothetical protein
MADFTRGSPAVRSLLRLTRGVEARFAVRIGRVGRPRGRTPGRGTRSSRIAQGAGGRTPSPRRHQHELLLASELVAGQHPRTLRHRPRPAERGSAVPIAGLPPSAVRRSGSTMPVAESDRSAPEAAGPIVTNAVYPINHEHAAIPITISREVPPRGRVLVDAIRRCRSKAAPHMQSSLLRASFAVPSPPARLQPHQAPATPAHPPSWRPRAKCTDAVTPQPKPRTERLAMGSNSPRADQVSTSQKAANLAIITSRRSSNGWRRSHSMLDRPLHRSL